MFCLLFCLSDGEFRLFLPAKLHHRRGGKPGSVSRNFARTSQSLRRRLLSLFALVRRRHLNPGSFSYRLLHRCEAMGDLIETLSAISSSAISSSVVSSSNSAPEFQTHRYHDVRLSLHCDGMPRGKPSAFPSLTSQPKPKRFERLAKENERTAIGHEKPAKESSNPASGS